MIIFVGDLEMNGYESSDQCSGMENMGENLVGYESSAQSTVKETLESRDY